MTQRKGAKRDRRRDRRSTDGCVAMYVHTYIHMRTHGRFRERFFTGKRGNARCAAVVDKLISPHFDGRII